MPQSEDISSKHAKNGPKNKTIFYNLGKKNGITCYLRKHEGLDRRF